MVLMREMRKVGWEKKRVKLSKPTQGLPQMPSTGTKSRKAI